MKNRVFSFAVGIVVGSVLGAVLRPKLESIVVKLGEQVLDCYEKACMGKCIMCGEKDCDCGEAFLKYVNLKKSTATDEDFEDFEDDEDDVY